MGEEKLVFDEMKEFLVQQRFHGAFFILFKHPDLVFQDVRNEIK